MSKRTAAQTDDQEAAPPEATSNVQGELPERYGIALGILAASKRRQKRQLLQDALDLLFAHHGVSVTPDSAERRGVR